MARERSKDKEQLILQTSKSLFARKGFFNTSISDIVKASKLPVGSIYTYFSSKEEIVKVIIEDGWTDLHERLDQKLSTATGPQEKMQLLLDEFFPELFKDIDLITILLSEAIDYTKLEEKLEKLTKIVFSILKELDLEGDVLKAFSPKELQAAFIVYFLGVLHAVKLAKTKSIKLQVSDIMNFLRNTIRNSLGTSL